jgi:hypothetical protein
MGSHAVSIQSAAARTAWSTQAEYLSEQEQASPAVAEFPVLPIRIALTDPQHAWVEPVKRRLVHICALAVGWDGYRGMPTRFDIAYFAFELLKRVCRASTPAPSIVPLPSGGLQIEWHQDAIDIELAIQTPNTVDVWIGDPGNGEETELSLTNNLVFLDPWIAKLG